MISSIPDSTIERLSGPSTNPLAVAGKMVLTAIVIAGLVAATIFSGGAFLGFIAAGAIGWQIFLTGIAFGVSVITTGGAFVSAWTHQMGSDTGHNGTDAKNFLIDTSLSCAKAVSPIWKFATGVVQDMMMWNFLTK